LADVHKSSNSGDQTSKAELLKEINILKERISKALNRLLDDEIDSGDYKTVKAENEYKINVLEAKLAEVAATKGRSININPYITSAIPKLTNLDRIYNNLASEGKRELIGSMYPKKFTYEELQHRTAKVDGIYERIYLININLDCKKEGQSDRFLVLAHCGSPNWARTK